MTQSAPRFAIRGDISTGQTFKGTGNVLSVEPEFQDLLRGIQIRFGRFFALVLEGKNTTLSQFNVLATLASEGPLPMNRVAKELHITKPAITHLVDRLELERDTHQGQVVSLDGHKHRVRGRERIDREKRQGGGAIKQNMIVFREHWL